MINPEEIERYEESSTDRIYLICGGLMLLLAIALILWNPDVEAIGSWISSLIN